MAKLKVQAQHLQPGDIVGISQDIVCKLLPLPDYSYIYIELLDDAGLRSVLWGKYTQINVERK